MLYNTDKDVHSTRDTDEEEENMSNFDRRDFLKLAGKTVLGAAAVTAIPAAVSA